MSIEAEKAATEPGKDGSVSEKDANESDKAARNR